MPDVWSILFNLEPGPADAWVYLLGIVFLVTLVGGQVVHRRRRVLFRGSPYLWVAEATGQWATIIGALGVVFALGAILVIPILNLRFWLAATALSGLILLLWLAYVVLVRIPRDRSRYYHITQSQRYLPTAGGKKKGKGRRR